MTIDLNLLKKITAVDFKTHYSTGGFLYPPYFIWKSVKNIKEIEEEIKKSIKNSSKNFSIYVHFPFCVSKCSFCRFYSIANKRYKEYDNFLDLMVNELKIWSDLIRASHKIKDKIKIESIYCGGGTPSLFNLEKFFKELKNNFSLENSKQINIEASLDSLNEKKLLSYKKIGVNRLLIGVQSFDPKVLEKNNRSLNNLSSFEKIYKFAKKIGIPHINIELIVGLPGQTKNSFLRDLKRLIDLKVDSIHRYRFICTPLSRASKINYHHDLDYRLEMLNALREGKIILKEKGYIPYGDEWILPGKKNNRNFQTNFSRPNVLTIGPSAGGSIKSNNRIFHIANANDLNNYKNRIKNNNLAIDSYFNLEGKKELICRSLVDQMRHSYFELNNKIINQFKNEFDFLKKNKIIEIRGNKIENYLNRVNNLDYSIYPKVFYSPKILKECKKVINKKYSNTNFDLSFLSL